MNSATPPPPPPPPPLSKTILLGKYQLGCFLGRGSFAKVYRAKSLVDDSEVAIKIIEKSKKVDATMEDRILREVAAMRRLQDHPNVLKIHEVMATKTKIYLVMELASGGDLEKVLRRGRLKVSDVGKYFSQLVSALCFCHQNGIAHRDVKPQNLLLDQNGNLKVSDFGLSALPEQLKNGLLHTSCGTPAFAAPEVLMRRPYRGTKADAWSCGVILFNMLTGSLPFDYRNQAIMYNQMCRRQYELPSWVSKHARDIIRQLLDPTPSTRLSLERLMETSWYKSLVPKPERQSIFLGRKSKHEIVCSEVNAFDIISLSSGLDLSGLFQGEKRKEKRYTSTASVESVVERVREVGERLGYKVESGKKGVVGLRKGRVGLVVEVTEVAKSFLLVEVKMAEGGAEFHDGRWRDLETELGDIIVSWPSDAME
ncbi:hypothetical protein SLE2022_169300 [Rubroshorea leprosula]